MSRGFFDITESKILKMSNKEIVEDILKMFQPKVKV